MLLLSKVETLEEVEGSDMHLFGMFESQRSDQVRIKTFLRIPETGIAVRVVKIMDAIQLDSLWFVRKVLNLHELNIRY